ncbi:MAG: hypothetical protein ACREDR_09555 [Blastocatellia bacterium]
MANRILLVVCIALLSCLLFIGARSPMATSYRWEYRVLDDPTEAQLNYLGNQGWEITQAVGRVSPNASSNDPFRGGGVVVYLKKVKSLL